MIAGKKLSFWFVTIALLMITVGCGSQKNSREAMTRSRQEVIQINSNESALSVQAVPEDRSAEEDALLATAVRLHIHGAGVSHGTVMAGRYLVTHNHFPFDLSQITTNPTEQFKSFSLYRADGRPLIDHSPLTNIVVISEKAETLVLDFGKFGDQGFFDFLGVPSAQFAHDKKITAGFEVAQLNWNGQQAYIIWVKVREVLLLDGVPTIVLESTLAEGASGGGIFLNGQHVANNWSTVTIEESGQVIDIYSRAARNDGNFQLQRSRSSS
ncbi:MAG: hypothetical protein QNJ45_01380 [Ardenticatenaceae bacterium]|nr:hypothetical protein [Ardenticatenaceae bacterium]